MKWTWIGWMSWRCSIRHTGIRMCVHSAGEHLVLLEVSPVQRCLWTVKVFELKSLKWPKILLKLETQVPRPIADSKGREKTWVNKIFFALNFMLESRFGESESNRHHPAVRHNYPIFLITAAAAIMKHDELMRFSLFDLFTDRWKIVVLKSLWRDFDLREVHKKKNEEYLFC